MSPTQGFPEPIYGTFAVPAGRAPTYTCPCGFGCESAKEIDAHAESCEVLNPALARDGTTEPDEEKLTRYDRLRLLAALSFDADGVYYYHFDRGHAALLDSLLREHHALLAEIAALDSEVEWRGAELRRVATQPQPSDTERMDWLEGQGVVSIYLRDGMQINPASLGLRAVLDLVVDRSRSIPND